MTKNINPDIDQDLPRNANETIVTRERVFAAAKILTEKKERVTQAKIRKILGGGSFGPIGDFINEWRNEQKTKNEMVEIPIPTEISAQLKILSVELWQTATKEAENKLTLEREALKEAQESAATAISDTNDAILQLESEAVSQRDLVANKEEEISYLIENNESFKKELNECLITIRSLEIECADKVRLESNIKELKQEKTALTEKILSLSSENAIFQEKTNNLKESLLEKSADLTTLKTDFLTVEKNLSEIKQTKEKEISKIKDEKSILSLENQKNASLLESEISIHSEAKKKLISLRESNETYLLALGELKSIQKNNTRLNERIIELEKS